MRSQVVWQCLNRGTTSPTSVVLVDLSVTEAGRKKWWSRVQGCGPGVYTRICTGVILRGASELWWSLRDLGDPPWARHSSLVPQLDMWKDLK